jgi:thiamine-phosphate pyrophosphorylase
MLLYYITDRKGFAGNDRQQREALLRKIAEAARANVDYIQLREKDLSPRDLECLALDAVCAMRENSVASRLLINARADVALACGADGVHLPAGELSAVEIRELWMKCSDREPLIGVSAHSPADVREAESCGASFAVLAPIFEKVGTDANGIGLDALRLACARSQVPNNIESQRRDSFPVLALGGVTVTNASECLQAGAAGVAGIRLFQYGDIFDTVQRLRALVSSRRYEPE